MAFIIIGAGVGCFMYAFVNSRYNEKNWIDSRFIFATGLLAVLIGLLLLLLI